MKRATLMLGFAFLLLGSVGCNFAGRHHCNHCSGPLGCRPCHLGWQRGGTDYGRFLGCNHLGGQGGCGAHGCQHGNGHAGHAGGHGVLSNHQQFANAQPSGAGPATGGPMAQVAYPYYTTRGPRDFFLDDPPTIGR